MKIKIFFLAISTMFSMNGISQTLYVPDGTLGIKSSSPTDNVGIGISNPSYKFHLSSTTNGWASVIQNQGSIIYSANANGTSDGHGMQIRVNNKREDRYGLLVYDGSNYLFHVRNDGNVGIGCNPGVEKFKIYGAVNPSFVLSSSVSRLQIGVSSSNGAFGTGAKTGDVVLRTIGGTNSLYFYIPNVLGDGNSSIGFGDDKNSKWFQIRNDKTVRIDGKVYATEIEVKINVWSDFVFNSDYKLKPLDEVEKFIIENKHLEGIPTAAEVCEKGINIADMNAVLLQKVEELTLYLIELKKDNDILKAKVEAISK